ncbi:MAG: hypothetical protein B6I28_04125 [Fusobacteriia bacterium 4572_132]|nr:MAG: hypothetical protein B6I28_04125 [Fusobacteriia bacterium 4572_132]
MRIKIIENNGIRIMREIIKMEALKSEEQLVNKKKVLMIDKVKSISGILKTNKSYKELRGKVIEERIQKF